MTETQRRIRAYKKALPALRERVIAVAVLLAMSASMLGTASFAWLTLSTAPEVSGMATTVAANGNLEIALAQGDSMGDNGIPIAAEEPDKSGTGDSSVTQGIVNSNVTWGNLVNLSEPEYGIENIVLRPALLNNSNRLRYPLYGATYGADGRVGDTNARYEYASWQKISEDPVVWDFAAGAKTRYGVRAISTVGYDTQVADAILQGYINDARTAYNNSRANYLRLVKKGADDPYVLAGNRSCIEALEGLVTVFAQDEINAMGTVTIDSLNVSVNVVPEGVEKDTKNSCSAYIYNFYELLRIMRDDVLYWEGEGLRQLANSQAYSKTPEGQNANTKTFERLVPLDENDDKALLHYTDAELRSFNGGTADIVLETYEGFKENYETVLECMEELENNPKITAFQNGIESFRVADENSLPPIYFADVSATIDKLVVIDTATINEKVLGDFDANAAIDLIMNQNNAKVILHDGLLVDFEKRAIEDSLGRINADVSVTVQTGVKVLFFDYREVTVKGKVWTAARDAGEGAFLNDINKTGDGGVAGVGDAVAEDTYGMAIDLWVRTNYPNAILTLEGNVLTEKRHAQDANGNYLYTVTMNDGTNTFEVQAYKTSPTDSKYYVVGSGEEVPSEQVTNATPVETDVIIGYEGENRVWSEEALANMADKGYIEKDSTTQGAGSCFVFYADSKPEETKLLEMLQYFNVAFIGGDGAKLATAKLNVEKAFVNQGKVTVPLEIVDSKVTYGDEEDPDYGIMTLTANQATRITAIVYLDGTELKNENVLEAGEMNGQLNIQFSTDTLLQPTPDDKLQREYRTITVSAQSDNGQTWPLGSDGKANPQISYNKYDAAGHDITVNLNVDGVQPTKISGYFVRMINSTQGSRMETVDFTAVAAADEEGSQSWTANFHLTDPGQYILSDLLVDGMQYPLEPNSETDGYLTVFIPGLSLGTVTTLAPGVYPTDEDVYPVTVTAEIVADMGTPNSVTAYFYEKENKSNLVAASMSFQGGTLWSGTANFTNSGTYILDSITVDGRSLDIPNKTELTFHLGLQCVVYSLEENGNINFSLKEGGVQVHMGAVIKNNRGQTMTDLPGAAKIELVYNFYGNRRDPFRCEMTRGADGRYTGILNLTKDGEFYFDSLNIGSTGTIDNNSEAPTLTVDNNLPLDLYDPDKTGYTAFAEEWQFAFAGSADPYAELYVRITNSRAVVWAEMVHTNAQGQEITKLIKSAGYDPEKGMHLFNLSVNNEAAVANGWGTLPEAGTWTLKQIYCQNVSVNGINYPVTDEANVKREYGSYPLDPNDVSVTLVNALTVTGEIVANDTSYPYNQYQTVPFSGSFLQEHDATLNITVQDQDGNDLQRGLVGATWYVDYDENTDDDYGGYDGASQPRHEIPETSADGKTVSMTETFQYAGEYDSEIDVKLDLDSDGVAEYSYRIDKGPKFTVTSTVPYVKFTATNPSVDRDFNGINESEDGNVTRRNTISQDGFSVTCYYQGEISEGDGCNIANSCTGYSASKATSTVFDLGTNYSKATLTIKSKGRGSDITFTYTPSVPSSEQNIGSTSGSGSNSERLGIGENAEGTTLSVTSVDGLTTYTFTLVHPLKATAVY